MSFQDKYQIQSALGEGESPSFRALQVSSGQTVLVHHLVTGKTPPHQPDLAILIFKFLSRASAEESRKLIDMGEDEGHIYVVTPDVPECRDLRQWLVSVTDAPKASAGPAKEPPGKEAPGPVNLDATSAFTTEALRQALRYAESAPAAASTAPTDGIPGAENLGATKAYTRDAMRQALREAQSVPAAPPPAATPPPASTEGTPSMESIGSTKAYTREAMRQALQEAKNAGAGPPPTPPIAPAETEGAPNPESLASTQAYTREAMKQALHDAKGTANPPPAAPPTSAPPAEKGHEDMKPFPVVPTASFEPLGGGVTDFTAFWEKATPESLAGQPVASAAPPASPKLAEPPSDVPAVTAEFLSYWQARKSMNLEDAPTAALPTLKSQAAQGKVSPEVAAAPADKASGTMILGGIKDLSLEKAAPPAGAPSSAPSAAGTSAADANGAENAPRPAIPAGFEVVFQSNKPRSRGTQLGSPNKTGVFSAPAPSPPPNTPKEAAPAPEPPPQIAPPAAEAAPKAAPPASSATPLATPPPPNPGETLVMNSASILGEPGPVSGPTRAPIEAPSPPPGKPILKEPAPATPPVPAPVVPAAPVAAPPPAEPTPKQPESATRFVAVPAQIPNATLRPTPVNSARPGEYTRMIQNVRLPADPLANPPAAGRPAASPSASSATLQTPSSAEAPAPLPTSRYIANDTPLTIGRKKRKAWVPIAILSSLFLLTVALLVFFAFKH